MGGRAKGHMIYGGWLLGASGQYGHIGLRLAASARWIGAHRTPGEKPRNAHAEYLRVQRCRPDYGAALRLRRHSHLALLNRRMLTALSGDVLRVVVHIDLQSGVVA